MPLKNVFVCVGWLLLIICSNFKFKFVGSSLHGAIPHIHPGPWNIELILQCTCTGVYLHRAQQGVFPLQEVLFPSQNIYRISKLIEIHEMLLRWIFRSTSINLCFGSPHMSPSCTHPLGPPGQLIRLNPAIPPPKFSGQIKPWCTYDFYARHQ